MSRKDSVKSKSLKMETNFSRPIKDKSMLTSVLAIVPMALRKLYTLKYTTSPENIL